MATTKVLSPVRFKALSHLCRKVSATASVKQRAISAFCFSKSVLACTAFKTAVLSPAKLKSQLGLSSIGLGK